MGIEERIAALENENRRLRDENDTLLCVIAQMKATLNRLLNRYIVNG